MHKLKKLLSAALALCLVIGMLATSASAATTFTYTYPSEPVAVDDSVLTTLTQRAATEIPLFFGVNVLGGNMFDGLKEIGGTVVSQNPDPYIWNFNYLWPGYERMSDPGEPVGGRSLPTGSYYEYIGNGLSNPNGLYSSGGANQVYAASVDELGGLGYAVGNRVDVFFGFNSEIIDQIDLVHSWKPGDEFYQEDDETYSPVIVDVQTGTVTSRLYSWAEMGRSLSAYLAANPGKSVRYDDPYTMGVNMEEYCAGIPYYIASLIANGTIEKKTAAFVSAIDGYTFTCINPANVPAGDASGNNRIYYDVYAQVHNFNFLEGNYTIADLKGAGVDVIMLGNSAQGFGSDASASDKQAILAGLVEIGYTAEDIPLVMDKGIYQVTTGNGYNYSPMSSMFVPWIQTYAYMDELAAANPAVNPLAIWQYGLNEFMHVEDSSAADVALYYIGSNWDSVDEEYDQVPDTTNYVYDKAAIAAAIQDGIRYALSSEAAANGNTLLPALRSADNAYVILTRQATGTKPGDGHEYITLTIDGQTKYLDLTELASLVEEESSNGGGNGGGAGGNGGAGGAGGNGGNGGGNGGNAGAAEAAKEYYDTRTSYQAIIDYYDSGVYGYGDDLQTTLQNYAVRMAEHVWQPDTTAPNTYGYGLTASTSAAPVVTKRFTDVASGIWYEDAVNWAVEQKITTGTGDGTAFSPTNTCTVGEILTFLWRAKGEPESAGNLSGEFSYDPNAYYYRAVMWALQTGVMDPANAYDPKHECTRSMAVEFLWKAAGSPEAPLASFSDMPADASYAQAVAWAVDCHITEGTGDGSTFSPDITCDRATIATFLYRAFSAA